jgi:5-methylcytosine-specific restriction endonuclease McrA
MAKSKRTIRRERLAASGYILVHPKPKPKKIVVNVQSDAFLSTYEWRRVRMMALKKYGPRCQCCGATPADGAVMNVDHIKPRKLFPDLALDINNLQILCHDCNHGKGNWDKTDWRPK